MAWSSVLLLVTCSNGVVFLVFFAYSCSLLQWRDLLYFFLLQAPMAWSSILILVPCSIGVVFFTLLVPCSIDVFFFTYSCSMLQWRGLLCLFLLHAPMAWSTLLILLHAPMAWSTLLILVTCSNGVVCFTYSCSMLQWRGLLYLFLFPAPMTWSSWSSLLILNCSLFHWRSLLHFSCSILHWRGFLYFFLFHAPTTWSSLLILSHAPMAWPTLLILVPCSNGTLLEIDIEI